MIYGRSMPENSGTNRGTSGHFVPLSCPACPAVSRAGTKANNRMFFNKKDEDKLRDNSGTNLHLLKVGQIFISVPTGTGRSGTRDRDAEEPIHGH